LENEFKTAFIRLDMGLKETLLDLYDIANSKDWKPWELQSRLRESCGNVIAVGDDLSFTVKLDKSLRESDLRSFGGRKCKIHPFKTAWRFSRGFVAFEGKFLRISRNIDKKLLSEILDAILPED
jgi:hypothetical protein